MRDTFWLFGHFLEGISTSILVSGWVGRDWGGPPPADLPRGDEDGMEGTGSHCLWCPVCVCVYTCTCRPVLCFRVTRLVITCPQSMDETTEAPRD